MSTRAIDRSRTAVDNSSIVGRGDARLFAITVASLLVLPSLLLLGCHTEVTT